MRRHGPVSKLSRAAATAAATSAGPQRATGQSGAAVDRTDVIEYAPVAGRNEPAADEGAPFRVLARGEALPGAAVALDGGSAHMAKPFHTQVRHPSLEIE